MSTQMRVSVIALFVIFQLGILTVSGSDKESDNGDDFDYNRKLS